MTAATAVTTKAAVTTKTAVTTATALTTATAVTTETTVDRAPGAPGCPKHMVYGPCGGVKPDGGCETGAERCVFVDGPVPRWPESALAPPSADPFAGMRRPLVIADLPAVALDKASLRECASALTGRVDAVLLGDHGGERVQFPPALRSEWVQAQGLRVWAGLNCRDRNRVALEGEIAGLAEVGVAGVHCVTGDHTSIGGRPDTKPVFDLDSTRLVALVAAAGLPVSVAENPAAPPVTARPERLAEKVRAGAGACFVNHSSGPAPVAGFVTAAVERGARIPYVACVPIVLDAGSAAVLRSFTGLDLPPGYLDGILAARDPFRAGIAAALDLSRGLLETGLLRGVNLSGGAAPRGEVSPLRVAQAMAVIARGLH